MGYNERRRNSTYQWRQNRRRVELYLTLDEYQALAEQAQAAGGSVSEWLRELAKAACRPVSRLEGRPVDIPPAQPETPAKPGGRYMAQALEDRILALRESGLPLSAVAQRLAEEGHVSATGAPYRTGTLTKAEARARSRRQTPKPPD